MKKISNNISDWLVEKGLNSDDREIYSYAIECLLNTILTFGIILIIGAVFQRFLITLTWMIFFLPLRHTSGGLHAPNHIGCLILSLSIGIGCIFLNSILAQINWFIWAGLIFNIIVIFAFAPVLHANHPLSKPRVDGTRRSARIIVCIESCIVILLYFFISDKFYVAALLGMLSATSSTLIGHFIN